ncbi:MAG: glycosyltransferase [Phycisphaerae bacterium]
MAFTPRTLLITPFFDAALPSGGVLLSIDVAREWLRDGRRVAVLCARRDRARGDLQRYVDRGQLTLHTIADEEHVRFTHHAHPDVGAAAARIIERFEPEIVHVHNTQGVLSAVRAALDSKAPTILTALDFGLICLNHCLHDGSTVACNGPESADKCRRCVQATMPATPRALSRILPRGLTRAIWPRFVRMDQVQTLGELRDLMLEILGRLDAIVAPSPALAEVLTRWRGGAHGVHQVLYGVSPEKIARPAKTAAGVARLAYLGGVERVKGLHVLLEAAARLRDGLALEIRALGGDSLQRALSRATAGARRYVRVCPPLFGANLAHAHAEFDAILVPSICHENSPFVILESLACGTPVVASNQPGIRHLIRPGVNGLLIPPGDADEWARTFMELTTSPDRLRQLGAAARFDRSTRDFLADVGEVESRLLGASPRSQIPILAEVKQALVVTR